MFGKITDPQNKNLNTEPKLHICTILNTLLSCTIIDVFIFLVFYRLNNNKKGFV